MNTQTIQLDVSKSPAIAPVLHLGQGDANGTTLVVELYDNSAALSMSGKAARLCIQQPRKAGYYEVDGTVSGSTATFAIDETYAASVAGVSDVAYVQVLEGTTVIASTNRFRVVVLNGASDGVDPATAHTNGVDEYLAAAEARERATLNEITSDAESAIASVDAKLSTVDSALADVDSALDAIGDVSELAVPLMSSTTRGGAKLGHGLAIDDGALSIGADALSGSASATEVTCTPAADAPMLGLGGNGWSRQESTVGKNLLPNTAASQTVNGVTFTVNPDGSVTASGTASADTSFTFSNSGNSIAAGSYMFSGCPSGGSTSTYRMTANVGGVWFTDTGSGNSRTVSSGTIGVASIVIASGYTCNNLTFYPQLESGSTATSYEPYTGGAPSPSPDFPQEIECVRGRNLLDLSSLEVIYNNGAQYSVSGDRLTLTKLFNDGSSFIIVKLPIKSGTYSLSVKTNNHANVALGYCDPDGSNRVQAVTPYSNISLTVSGTLNIPDGKIPVAWLYADRIVETNLVTILSDIQLTATSTPLPYVPYGHVGVEVRGKNLLDIEGWAKNVSTTCVKSGDTYTVGSIALLYQTPFVFSDSPINVIVTVGADTMVPPVNGRFQVGVYSNGVFESKYSYIGVNYQQRQLCEDVNAIRGDYSSNGQCTFDKPMVRLADNSNAEFEPYTHTTTPIPLPSKGFAAALPDGTADKLSIDAAGKWEWESECDEVTYDGSSDEEWGTGSYNQLKYACIGSPVNSAPVVSGGLSAYVSHYRNLRFNMFSDNTAYINNAYFTADKKFAFFDVNHAASTNDFKTWLASNPVTVLYPLATPTTESGYIDPPRLSDGCTVSIPELADTPIEVEWWTEAAQPVSDALEAMDARKDEEIAALVDRVAALEP